MVCPNPWRGGEHRNATSRHSDDAPAENDLWRVFCDVILEVAHNDKDEPGDAGRGTARVNTADVLQECGPSDSYPKR